MCESLSKINETSRIAIETYIEYFGNKLSGEVTSVLSEYTRVSISSISMQQNISDSVSKWLEDLLFSSRNIEMLAKSSSGVIGKGDEDLRIREMGSDVASFAKYKELTKFVMFQKSFLNVSCELLPLALHFPFSQTNFFPSSCFIIK